MARIRAKARILERTITAGNGPYALAGAVDGSYNRFSSIMAIGDTTTATIIEPGVAFWTGIVTYSAANQITLTTVEESKGTFGAGTKEVMAHSLASTAMFPEDIAGAIVTGGTSTAYTVASFRVYDTLARLNGNIIAFTPHTTNGATVTLNVDGLGAKPLRAAPSTELLPNVLVQGTPYLALYNHSDQVFYLHGFFGNPHNVPLGAGLDYWGATTPNSAFVFPAGQAISRTIYAALFSLIGTTYGSGDGSTTFNLPDKTGRVSAMKEASATRLTTAGGGVDGATLGAPGGAQNGTIAQANLPAATLTTTITDPGHAHTVGGTGVVSLKLRNLQDAGGSPITSVQFNNGTDGTIAIQNATTGITASTALGGSGTAFKVVQPTIVCNYIMRVL